MRGCHIAQDDFDKVEEVMREECLSGHGPYTFKSFQDLNGEDTDVCFVLVASTSIP